MCHGPTFDENNYSKTIQLPLILEEKMIRSRLSLFLVPLAMLIALTACKKKEQTPLMKKSLTLFQPMADSMPGSETDTPELIQLGKKLYFEKRLSTNETQSCNSCHRVDEKLGGVDNEPTSPGALGNRGGRNAPTVLNAGFHIAQFWDGRAKDLQAQAKGPILNPIEMAMGSDAEVIERIRKDEEYKSMFASAFQGEEDAITYDNIAEAIAAFERTLVTTDRFDDFLKGDASALNEEEQKGLETFLSTGCVSCHNGMLLGGDKYQKIGAVNPYETSDLGRYEVTKKEEDKYVFKVPSLRNIALTHPYFHDGSVKTLDEAVKKMAYHQLGKELSDEDVKSIVAFLKTLTDKKRL